MFITVVASFPLIKLRCIYLQIEEFHVSELCESTSRSFENIGEGEETNEKVE